MTHPQIKPASVALRPMRPEDCDPLLSWIDSADALYQWSGPWDFSWPLDRRTLLSDLEAAGDRRFLFAAGEGDDPRPVGHAMLTARPDHGIGVIGRVIIAPDRRGRGLGASMMRALARIAFDERSLHRLQLVVYDFNTPAIAAYRGAGFTIEGTQRDSARGSNGYWTSHVMVLLEPDYRRGLAGDAHSQPVRPVRMTDAAAIGELLTELGYPHNERQALGRLSAWAGSPRGTVLVTTAGDEVAGFVAVSAIPYIEREGCFARVVATAVRADHRRSGAGRRLLEAAEEWARSQGCVDVEVTSSRHRVAAHAFYHRLGYEDLCGRAARFKRTLDQRRSPSG